MWAKMAALDFSTSTHASARLSDGCDEILRPQLAGVARADVAAHGRGSHAALVARTFLLAGVALLSLAAVAAAVATWIGWKGDGTYLDATPDHVWQSVEPGTVVWLRGNRDRAAALTLADGREVFPTKENPRVLVECGPSRCAGTLVGAVEDYTAAVPLPAGWPAGVEPHVRIVRVGDPGARARARAQLVAAGAAVALALGAAFIVAWSLKERARAAE
jgi:hypothetical protein